MLSTLTTLLALALQAPQSPAIPVPTANNFRQWMEFIEPDATETAYRNIAWRSEFWPAVQEAKALGRPILFWTMNGHPLGCT
jgi:hypothetical protein